MDPEAAELAWRPYRWWRRILWTMLLGFLPAVWLFERVAFALSLGETAVVTFAFLWVASTFLCLVPRSEFRCPRCGERFHFWTMRGAFGLPFDVSNVWSRRCLHCGLRRYAVR